MKMQVDCGRWTGRVRHKNTTAAECCVCPSLVFFCLQKASQHPGRDLWIFKQNNNNLQWNSNADLADSPYVYTTGAANGIFIGHFLQHPPIQIQMQIKHEAWSTSQVPSGWYPLKS
jgi:hypothetical protein